MSSPVKMSIIAAETGMSNQKGQLIPTVTLIGRDEAHKKRVWRTSFYPYIVLYEKDYLTLKEAGFLKNLKIKEVSGFATRSIDKRVLTKLTFYDAGKVKDAIQSFNKWNKDHPENKIYSFEADLSQSDTLALRYLIDMGIKSAVEISGDGKTVTPIKELGIPQRRWYLDFESYTFKEYTSGISPKDPFIMVSVYDTYNNTMYTYYVINKKWSVKRQTEQCFIPFTEFKHVVKAFKTEPQFLDALMELVLELDPDKFLAWNLNRYDAPKWKQRMEANTTRCIYTFKSISPFKCIMQGNKLRIKGRQLFDEMVAFKQFTDAELASYALAFLTEEENLGFKKIPFQGTSGQCWDNAPDIVFSRNVNDVLIIKALDDKYGISETYEELQGEFGTLAHDTFVRNKVIDTALLRMVNGKIALRTIQYGKEEGDSSKLLGARVVEPEPDEYVNACQLDFGAEYPSIIEGFNISPETFRSTEPKEPHYHIHYSDPVHGEMDYYFLKEPVGLLPQLIKHFKAMRQYYKDELKKSIANKEPDHVQKKWERRQYNVKKSTNAIYGVMDYPKFRLHNSKCTQATALIGRISVEELAPYVKSLGYELLYGDTDSIFILLHGATKEERLKEGMVLQDKLNNHLSEFFTEKYGVAKAPADLALQKLYKKIMFVAKKNYAAVQEWDDKNGWKIKIDVKGIASVRSDASVLEKKALVKVIMMCLENEPTEAIEGFIKQLMEDFYQKKFSSYSYMEIAYPAQLKKSLKKDKKGNWLSGHKTTLPAHVKAAIYSNMYLNCEYTQGDKPRRLPVKFPKLKTSVGQQTLFNTTTFPTEWTYRNKLKSKREGEVFVRKEATFKVTDISVTEDMRVPPFFLGNIDYERIGERLEKKLRIILDIHTKKDKKDE